jgi:hypothetical protein
MDHVGFVFFGDSRKPYMFPGFLFEDMTDQVILMQALHNNNVACSLTARFRSGGQRPRLRFTREQSIYRWEKLHYCR